MSNLVTQDLLVNNLNISRIQQAIHWPEIKLIRQKKSKPFYVHFIYNDSLILQSLIYMSPSAYSPVAS